MPAMPAPAVMVWGDAEVRVAEDGTTTRLLRGPDLVVELGWVGAAGAPAEFEADDEVEHTLVTPEGRVFQRHSVLEGWRIRWVLTREARRPAAVEDRLRVRPGAEFSLWSWGSGATALLAVVPAHAAGPVLGLRLEQGYLEEFGSPSASSASVDYLVAPAEAELSPGQRLVTSVVADWYPALDELTARLPPWLGDTQLDAEEPWFGDVADFGVHAPDDVVVDYSDGVVTVVAEAGRRILDVQTPRGLSRVPLEWVPPMEAVLHAVARDAVGSGEPLDVAQALCVQFAADRRAVWLDPTADDLLDRVEWEAAGSVLGAAFGLARGRSLGEAVLVSDALRMLGGLPAGEGYGRVAMAGWIASLSVGLDARERCHELLGRAAVGRTAALESSLLHYRSADVGETELAGVANRLGGLLPGRAPLLSWTERARLVGLLELCPPEWERAPQAAQVAEKVRGQLLCAYTDGRIPDAEPLAWLLLNPGLGALG
ncbi:hypothetical protein [Propionicimonas sp.]|uniref:hypothetical protein n=1 Tax=Propionicimonas sp. TaxID=1955623 RepID=UPI0039E5323D